MNDDKIEIKGIAKIKEIDPRTGEIIDEEISENTVVYDAGANQIANYIAGNTPTDHFEYMAIGSGGTEEGTDDTSLDTQEAISGVITPTVEGDGSGNNRVVEWVNTFSAGDGTTSIEEMGMFNGSTGSGTDGMLNRVTFKEKDNLNNDLEITYQLTVG